MKQTYNILNKVDSVFFSLAQISLLLLMIITTADATSRYIFNKAIIGAHHFSTNYLMVIIVFLSISYVWKMRGHIRIDLFIKYLPTNLVKVLDIFYMILAAIFLAMVGYQALIMTQEAYVNQYTATGIIPWLTWTSWVWVPIGSFVFTLRLLLDVVYSIVNFNKGNSGFMKQDNDPENI